VSRVERTESGDNGGQARSSTASELVTVNGTPHIPPVRTAADPDRPLCDRLRPCLLRPSLRRRQRSAGRFMATDSSPTERASTCRQASVCWRARMHLPQGHGGSTVHENSMLSEAYPACPLNLTCRRGSRQHVPCSHSKRNVRRRIIRQCDDDGSP
jgi:hypothetical protein